MPENRPNLTARLCAASPTTPQSACADPALQPFREDAVDVFLQPELAEHPDFHDGWGEMRMRRVTLDHSRHEPRLRMVVTSRDQHRLHGMLNAYEDALGASDGFVSKLRDAHVVCPDCVSRDVVTMNSKVIYEDLHTNERLEVQLVYPEEAQSFGRVSVLDPLGKALLGRSVGTRVDRSEQGPLRVVDVPYQPEAAGHHHL